jgi:hypothetical protein
VELTDLLPLEKWTQIENEIHQHSGLESNVFNTDGIRITDNKVWVNRLCPAIKATDKGQSFICAVAHMNLANQAKDEKAAGDRGVRCRADEDRGTDFCRRRVTSAPWAPVACCLQVARWIPSW